MVVKQNPSLCDDCEISQIRIPASCSHWARSLNSVIVTEQLLAFVDKVNMDHNTNNNCKAVTCIFNRYNKMFQSKPFTSSPSVMVSNKNNNKAKHCVHLTFCLSWDYSFSTDDDNDTEVEAVDVDTELNLVTECWVEPQCGTVMNCMDQHRYFQGLKYQEIPQAVRSSSSSHSLIINLNLFSYCLPLCMHPVDT